jgi:hypothetical protein
MKGYAFMKPPVRPIEVVSKPITSKETVILFGDEASPSIQSAKTRIEFLGRTVEIQPRPAEETSLGICGEHMCSCTEPCKSIHYKAKEK